MLFTKPQNLNGTELIIELASVGVTVNRLTLEADGQLNVDIISGDAKKAETVITAHNGSTKAPEPSIDEKLALVGLSVNNLKAALGL